MKMKKKRLFCKLHKLDGMVDIINKKCTQKECKIRPHFNYENEKKPIYCFIHKLDGMIDIISKTCIYPECKIRPTFNYENEKKPIYCSTHKLDGMINIVDKTCINNWCYTIVQDKYEGYCLFCFVHIFPNKSVSRNYKTKEYAVVEFLKNQYPELTWNFDKIIENGCSKKRPDILLDLGYQVLIIEVDENQHINYDITCEEKRINQISNDLNNRPIIFIRFNPDGYIKNDKKVKSCWRYNKNGLCKVKKEKEWNERLNSLKEVIDFWINPLNQTSELANHIKLFYDT